MLARTTALVLSSFLIVASLVAQQGTVTTIAGVPGEGGNRDGEPRVATFNKPTWLDVARGGAEDGQIFVVDRVNGVIRRIQNSRVSTMRIAANYWEQNAPLYPFDFGGPLGGGIVIEPAGGGCGAGPWDRGFFVSSSGTKRVALVSPGGTLADRDGAAVVVIPGIPNGVARSWNYPGGISDLSARALYIADPESHLIWRVGFTLSLEACPQPRPPEVFAGAPGQPGSNDGAALAARFREPRGVAAGPDGSVYVADSGNHTIRKIARNGTVTTVAGEAGVPGDGLRLNLPSGIDVDANGVVYFADTNNHSIRRLTPDGTLSTVAGLAYAPGSEDGVGSAARFNGPVGVRVMADGGLLVADTSNHTIRRITFAPLPRRRTIAPHSFESAAFSWKDSGTPVRVRASADGDRWSEWQTLRVDHDLAGDGFVYSGIIHFGEEMKMIETDVDVKPAFFPIPERRPRQIAESYRFGSLEIVSRTDWGCPDGEGSRWTPAITTVTHAIVHHTAGANAVPDWAAEVRNIWQFHTVDRGWGDIGYNFLIDPNGVVYEGRAGGDGSIGAHFSCRNTNTAGVSLLGTYSTTPPTAAALASLRAILRELTSRFGLDPMSISVHVPSGLTMPVIASHRDGNDSPLTCTRTECPGDALYALLPAIRAEVAGRGPMRRRAQRP